MTTPARRLIESALTVAATAKATSDAAKAARETVAAEQAATRKQVNIGGDDSPPDTSR